MQLGVQWLNYETDQTGVFWEFSWNQIFVCIICETCIALECAPKPPWPTGFEKSKISQPNPEKLQFKGSKIQAIWLDLRENAEKQAKMPKSFFL